MYIDQNKEPRKWVKAGFITYFLTILLTTIVSLVYTNLGIKQSIDISALILLAIGLGIIAGVFGVVAVPLTTYGIGSLIYRISKKNRISTLAGYFLGLILSLPIIYAILNVIYLEN